MYVYIYIDSGEPKNHIKVTLEQAAYIVVSICQPRVNGLPEIY